MSACVVSLHMQDIHVSEFIQSENVLIEAKR